MTASCQRCGSTYDHRREAAGYILCLPCGDWYAKQVKFAVVPLHKGAYTVAPDAQFIRELNPKFTHR